MPARETERLAALEQKVHDMANQLAENTRDTKAIRATLDNLTGGKQALMWITGIFISAMIAITTWLGIHHK